VRYDRTTNKSTKRSSQTKTKIEKNKSNSNLHYILQNEKHCARKLRKAKENNPNEQKNSSFEIKKHFVYPLKNIFNNLTSIRIKKKSS
jgi:hypothetical protein